MSTSETENTLPVGTPMQPVYLVQANNRKTDDEIDLRELWNALWQGKVTIIAITSVFAIASVIIALMLPKYLSLGGTAGASRRIPRRWPVGAGRAIWRPGKHCRY